MRYLLFTCLLLVGLVQAHSAETAATLSEVEKVSQHLQNCSVTIKKSNYDRGSGTVITRLVDGRKINFILTANHVINDLRHEETVTTQGGDKKTTVSYRVAEILQEWIDDKTGERVGETKVFATVLSVDKQRDIALLRVKAKGWRDCSIVFYQGTRIPGPGIEIFHCGSPGGQSIGAASVLRGNIARIGCFIEEFSREPFDQLNVAGLPGSSGGMITNEKGEWIGMITLGLRSGGDNFHWMVPIRVVREWVKDVGIEWLLESNGQTTEEALKKVPLEHVRPGFSQHRRQGKPIPATIRRMDVKHND